MPLDIQNKLIDIIKENWCCFHPEGVKIPIRDYEVIIDTGTCKPFAAKNKRYGMHEAPIMQKAIDGLLSNDQIGITVDGEWLATGTLTGKPHQKKIINIDDFI